MKKHLHLLVVALALCFAASAQSGLSPSVIANSGGSGQTGKTQLSWTLGEAAVATLPTASGFLTEGFQQAEMLRVEWVAPNLPNASGAPDAGGITIAPNPVSAVLTIRISEDWRQSSSTAMLFDVNGQQIQTTPIAPGAATSELDLSRHPSGIYWLRIVAKDAMQAQTFKVIKIQ